MDMVRDLMIGNGYGDDRDEGVDGVFFRKILWIRIIFIMITIGDQDRHFILDSACNALYVFSDKTLRAQSENQSPR